MIETKLSSPGVIKSKTFDFVYDEDDLVENVNNTTVNASMYDDINKAIEKETNSKYNDIVEKLRENLFTLFGIFASIVAFLLVEVQVLKNATSWQVLAGLSLILLGALSFFVLLIKVVLLLRDKFNYKENITGILIVVVLLITSILFIGSGVYLASNGPKNHKGSIKYEKNFYSDINIR